MFVVSKAMCERRSSASSLQFGEDFDVLVIVDLEISQHQPAGGLVESEGFLKPKIVAVEIARRGQVVGLQTDVGDADDRRARLSRESTARPAED